MEVIISRAERLLNLVEEFRRRRRPVSGDTLAGALGNSIRTVYRDIASLRALGASIEGEPDLCYVRRSGSLLPPIMFPGEEIDALVLGARWVAERADPVLAQTAHNALARLTVVLPAILSERIETSYLVVGPAGKSGQNSVDITSVRQTIRMEHKLRITYSDAGNIKTERLIWPFLLGFFDGARRVSAWRELRVDIRHFRTDRIVAIEETHIRYQSGVAIS